MFTKKHILLTIIGLLVLALAACTASTTTPGAAPTSGTGGITVVGHGEAMGKPDQAEVRVGVEIFAETVEEATSENGATIQALMDALEAQGIAPEDVQTANYSLWAEQQHDENGPTGITGYRVSNQVNVTIRDIDKVGDVLAAVTDAGANSIQGISFSVADPAGLEADAREQAITDARERAQSLAELTGVELGDVVDVSEVIGQQPVFGRGGGIAVEEAAAPSISPGQLSYSVQVQVTFAIQ